MQAIRRYGLKRELDGLVEGGMIQYDRPENPGRCRLKR